MHRILISELAVEVTTFTVFSKERGRVDERPKGEINEILLVEHRRGRRNLRGFWWILL